MTVYIRAGSHVARGRLERFLGRKTVCYFSWNRHATGGFHALSDAEWEALRMVQFGNARKGLSRVRNPSDLRECVDWGAK